MKTDSKSLQIVANFLESKGYRVYIINDKYSRFDLIATKNNKTHRIEVKSRRCSFFKYPTVLIEDQKLQHTDIFAYLYDNNTTLCLISSKKVSHYPSEEKYCPAHTDFNNKTKKIKSVRLVPIEEFKQIYLPKQ